jgi:ABC-type antimicrobial peptide transport system permease subunit
VFASVNGNENTFHILLGPDSENAPWRATIAKINGLYSSVYPGEEFAYNFLDDNIRKFYITEENTSHLLKWATGLAVLISCLGLLGLVIYTTRQRTREIGVRKVLGASVSQIVSLISKDFIKGVMIAFVIAAPVAWWGTGLWMQEFAYRTPVSVWLFVLGGGLMLVIAIFTLGLQTLRAATANPVESLRTE